MLKFDNKRIFLFVLLVILLGVSAFSFLDYFNVLSQLNALKLNAHASSIFEIRAYWGKPDSDFKFEREDGLEIGASLYGTKGEVVKPGIILLHGANNIGRKAPFYRVLSSKLVEKGYIVLSIDLAGYGESGDPFQSNALEALDHTKEVSVAVDYLKSLENLDREKIYIIGHSRGVETAMKSGIGNDDIKKIVVIGPPQKNCTYCGRWEMERQRREILYDKDLPEWFTIEVAERINSEKYIENFIGYFTQERHKPFLIIDNELNLQGVNNEVYLTNLYVNVKGPKRLSIIKNSNHYSNVFEYKGRVFYNKIVVNDLVNEIDLWLRQPRVNKNNGDRSGV
jgi:pimeloyl-ACP methyl ester carboxylesterase